MPKYPTAKMYNTTISTERRSNAVSSGDVTYTWASNLTSIPASVQPASSSEALTIQANRNTETVDIYCNDGADIINTDRVTNDADSRVYSIVRPRDAAGRNRVLHIIGVLVEGVTSG